MLMDTKGKYNTCNGSYEFLSFLDEYCANNTYSITAKTELYTIPRDSVACFLCNLTGGGIPDIWTSNGIVVNNSIYLGGGILLVENSSIFFTHLLPYTALICHNVASNVSSEALISLQGNFLKY